MGNLQRHLQSANKRNMNSRPGDQRKGPLRRIVGLVTPCGTSMMERAVVRLECGHEVYSDGKFKARCEECTNTEGGK